MSSFNNTTTRARSNFWYILPIFGGVVGGMISWFAIRHDDPRKAKNNLLLGIILTAIPIILTIIPIVMFGTIKSSPIELVNPYNPPITWIT